MISNEGYVVLGPLFALTQGHSREWPPCSLPSSAFVLFSLFDICFPNAMVSYSPPNKSLNASSWARYGVTYASGSEPIVKNGKAPLPWTLSSKPSRILHKTVKYRQSGLNSVTSETTINGQDEKLIPMSGHLFHTPTYNNFYHTKRIQQPRLQGKEVLRQIESQRSRGRPVKGLPLSPTIAIDTQITPVN